MWLRCCTWKRAVSAKDQPYSVSCGCVSGVQGLIPLFFSGNRSVEHLCRLLPRGEGLASSRWAVWDFCLQTGKFRGERGETLLSNALQTLQPHPSVTVRMNSGADWWKKEKGLGFSKPSSSMALQKSTYHCCLWKPYLDFHPPSSTGVHIEISFVPRP